MINFRYDILKKLGEGGSGEVFLVEDTIKNARLAMKVFASSAAQHTEREAISREFSILSHLSNPNLVRIFDFDTIVHTGEQRLVGKDFYTMEYLNGSDALSYFSRCAMGSEKIRQLEEILIQTLGVLEYIHRRGIIHFDVKPQNLFIIENNGSICIKLTDFGFSTKKVEAVDIPIRGTLEYIAPEIIQGKEIDHRIDLYSLGITMFQLIEGHCPFQASTPVELLRKIAFEELPRICELNGSSTILSNIVAQLCRKTPQERGGGLQDVMELVSSPEYEESAKRSFFVYENQRCAGRENELRVVEDSLHNLLTMSPVSPQTILVSGPKGIGKTTFLTECARRARAKGLFVVESKTSGEPLASLHTALQLVEIELKKKCIAPDGSSPADVIVNASSSFPVMLLIDDVHEIDTASLNMVGMLAETKARGRVIMLAGVSGEEVKAEVFSHAKRLSLSELSEEHVTEMLRDMFGEQFISTGIAKEIYSDYGGRPSILVEAMKSITEAFPLTVLENPAKHPGFVHAVGTALSKTLDKFFVHNFQQLSREHQIVLENLSCFEDQASVALLKSVIPFDKSLFDQALVSLTNTNHIRISEDARRCAIRHRRLKKHVYDSIHSQHLKLHRVLAEAMKQVVNRDDWREIAELARQTELICEHQEASLWYEHAGDCAASKEENAEAAALFRKAIIGVQNIDRPKTFELMTKLGSVLFASGSFKDCIEVYEKILGQFAFDDDRGVAVRETIGKAYAQSGENAKALSQFEQILKYELDDAHRFAVQQEIVALKIAEGCFDEAIRLSEAQKEFAQHQPDRQLLALVVTDLAIARFYKGNYQDALDSFSNALTIYSECENRNKTIDALNNIGNVLSAMGDYRAALGKWNQALELMTNDGPRNQYAQIINNVGIAHFRLREFAQAKSCYQQANDLYGECSSKNGIAWTLSNLGEVFYAEGEYERARNSWIKALDLYKEMQDVGGIVQTCLEIAQVYLAVGECSHVHRMIADAESLIRQYNLPIYEALLHYLRGKSEVLSQSYSEALEDYDLAEEYFRRTGAFTGGIESEKEKMLSTLIRKAEVLLLTNEPRQLCSISPQLLSAAAGEYSPIVVAEKYYVLGIIAREHPEISKEKSLVYFRQGLAEIENEEISEISWKLSYALGQEYAKRGQREKAREQFRNAKLVVEFFTSKFVDQQLRELYVLQESRSAVMSENV